MQSSLGEVPKEHHPIMGVDVVMMLEDFEK
jgi:hypothetical protein